MGCSHASSSGYDGVIGLQEGTGLFALPSPPRARTTVIGNGLLPGRFWPIDAQCRGPRTRPARRSGLRRRAGHSLAGRLAREKRVLALLEALRPLLGGRGAVQGSLRRRRSTRGRGWLPQPRGSRPQPPGAAGRTGSLGTGMAEIYGDQPRVRDRLAQRDSSDDPDRSPHRGRPARRSRGAMPSFVDLVRDGYNGFLTDTDAEIAPRAGPRSCKTSQPGEAFATHARAHSAQFTVEVHVDRLERLYGQVIDHHRA